MRYDYQLTHESVVSVSTFVVDVFESEGTLSIRAKELFFCSKDRSINSPLSPNWSGSTVEVGGRGTLHSIFESHNAVPTLCLPLMNNPITDRP